MKNCLLSFLFVFYFILGNLGFAQDEEVKELRINPNPTNGIVNIEIKYSLPEGSRIIDTFIEVFSLNGELITKRPFYVNMPYPGVYTISDIFYLNECASGIYLIKIDFLNYLLVSRLLLIK